MGVIKEGVNGFLETSDAGSVKRCRGVSGGFLLSGSSIIGCCPGMR